MTPSISSFYTRVTEVLHGSLYLAIGGCGISLFQRLKEKGKSQKETYLRFKEILCSYVNLKS
jgi:hypothetical protein